MSAGFHWSAWLGLIPIFAAIRRFSGVPALAGGAVWGVAVYLSAVGATALSLPITFSGFVVYMFLPAGYVYLMSLFSRRYWYSTLAMALGWIVVELAVNAIGVRPGLITSEHIGSPALRVIADFLGTGFIAFFIACAGAIVITIVSNLRFHWQSTPLIIPRYGASRFIHELQSHTRSGRRFRPTHPRGPPLATGSHLP